MKKFYLLLLLTLSSSLFAQEGNQGTGLNTSFLGYYGMTNYMQGSPGAFKFGLYGFSNPAMNNLLHDSDMMIGLQTNNTAFESIDSWTIQSAGPGGGFGVISTTDQRGTVYDYRISTAFGSREFSFGLGYGFVGGDKTNFARSNTVQWGFIWRPFEYLSLGGTQTWAIDNNNLSGQVFANNQSVAEIAIRPFGNEILTLFADGGVISNNLEFDNFSDNFSFSAGGILEALPGFRLSARYMNIQDIEVINYGVDISYGISGLSANGSSSESSDRLTFISRTGAMDRTFFDDISPVKYYVKFNLTGGLKYQRNRFFDDSKTLLNTLLSLDRIKENDAIKGVIINTIGFAANPSMRWEIREKIKEIKRAGKKVYIFMERGDLNTYHLASVADKIIMDEMGSMTLHGFVFGRSFYKNLLDKYDIGFNEIRLFKYKSAVESFSREDYSEGNIEQNQALIDSWYKTTLDEITKQRSDLTKADLQKIMDSKLFINAKYALENNLIDGTGRWHELDSAMKQFDDDFSYAVDYGFIASKPVPYDDRWGYTNKSIAVVYVDGVCAMESGINARKLVNYVESVVNNTNIKAVILRVDSPGGDALASEYISKVVRDNKGKKPIIVSQGMLAASGGYWLSMDGDQILSSPYTITGSIGVISAWMYDKGAADRIGITTDQVKVGKYADLGFAWRDPIIGLGLPVRNITGDEEQQWKDNILDLYGEFITKVADGRGMDSLDVHEVAQGRIWTGVDAMDKGLVDKIGGLSRAINLAKKEVGIKEDEEINIYEYPKPEAFDFGSLLGQFVGVETEKVSERIETLQWIYQNNGYPMHIVPLEYLEYDFDK